MAQAGTARLHCVPCAVPECLMVITVAASALLKMTAGVCARIRENASMNVRSFFSTRILALLKLTTSTPQNIYWMIDPIIWSLSRR